VSRRPRSGVAGAERSRSVSVGVLDLSYFAPFGSLWSDLHPGNSNCAVPAQLLFCFSTCSGEGISYCVHRVPKGGILPRRRGMSRGVGACVGRGFGMGGLRSSFEASYVGPASSPRI
jgi:hypothetical protein